MLDELTGKGFVLIGAGMDPRATLNAEEKALWDTVGARYVAMYEYGRRPTGGLDRAVPTRLIEVEDPEGTFHLWLRASGGRIGTVAIVRPDKFVFGMVPARALGAATHELARQLHRTGTPGLRPAPRSLEPALKEAA
jgi:3-(3-hydroxy-phenyl)propionate hydroxylase